MTGDFQTTALNDYCREMSRDGVWGGDCEIEAIALAYRKQIAIYVNRGT